MVRGFLSRTCDHRGPRYSGVRVVRTCCACFAGRADKTCARERCPLVHVPIRISPVADDDCHLPLYLYYVCKIPVNRRSVESENLFEYMLCARCFIIPACYVVCVCTRLCVALFSDIPIIMLLLPLMLRGTHAARTRECF